MGHLPGYLEGQIETMFKRAENSAFLKSSILQALFHLEERVLQTRIELDLRNGHDRKLFPFLVYRH
jgi:hypothetical protein